MLGESREELSKSNIRQAAEKLWGAAALAVKAYAYWREGKRLSNHGELWEWKRRLEDEFGEWASDSWYAAGAMHICIAGLVHRKGSSHRPEKSGETREGSGFLNKEGLQGLDQSLPP